MTILKEYRINHKLKQYEMAEKLDCSLQSYRLYENGDIGMPVKIIINFLKLKGTQHDMYLVKELEDIYGKEKL